MGDSTAFCVLFWFRSSACDCFAMRASISACIALAFCISSQVPFLGCPWLTLGFYGGEGIGFAISLSIYIGLYGLSRRRRHLICDITANSCWFSWVFMAAEAFDLRFHCKFTWVFMAADASDFRFHRRFTRLLWVSMAADASDFRFHCKFTGFLGFSWRRRHLICDLI